MISIDAEGLAKSLEEDVRDLLKSNYLLRSGYPIGTFDGLQVQIAVIKEGQSDFDYDPPSDLNFVTRE